MTPHAVFDAALIQKYERALASPIFPPPALFRESFGAQQYAEQVELSNGDPIPRHLSLAVTLPGAAPFVHRGKRLRMLERESVLKARLFDPDRHVVELHLDGSVPASDEHALLKLLSALRRSFAFDKAARQSVAFDCAFVEPSVLSTLANSGFTRLQLAVTSAPDVEHFAQACRVARAEGFVDVSLVYSPCKHAAALPTLLEEEPDVISLLIAPGCAGVPQLAARQVSDACLQLMAAGYTCLGRCQFAKRGALRNRETCALCATERVGMGPGALSRVGQSYSQNEWRLMHYCNALNRGELPVRRGLILGGDNIMRRDLLDTLACCGYLNLQTLEQRHGVAFRKMFAREMAALEAMAEDGLVNLSPGVIELQPLGYLLFGAIAHVFDGHLRSNVAQLPVPTAPVWRLRTP